MSLEIKLSSSYCSAMSRARFISLRKFSENLLSFLIILRIATAPLNSKETVSVSKTLLLEVAISL